MKEAVGYFYVSGGKLYYVSIELDSVVEKKKFYAVRVYCLTDRVWLCDAVASARSVAELEEAVEKLIEGVRAVTGAGGRSGKQ